MPREVRLLVLTQMSMSHMREVVGGIRAVQRVSPQLFVAVRDVSERAMALLPELICELRVNGIMGFFAREPMISPVMGTGLPALTFSAYQMPPTMPAVLVDNTAIGSLAAEYFLGLGLKHFAYFGQPSGFAEKRRDGFRARLGEYANDLLIDESAKADLFLPALLKMPQPIGVFCANDIFARDLVDSLVHLGLKVPEQYAVLGVDNATEYCESGTVSISSLSQNGQEIGRRAIAAMLAMIEGNTPRFPILVPPGQLIERESTLTIAARLPEVADAIRYIRTHACDGIDVNQVVQASGRSRATIDRHIRDVLGHSPHVEIRNLQMARARELLSSSTLDIRTIADRCGFDTPQYFVRVFRKHHQQTPTQYRQARNQPDLP